MVLQSQVRQWDSLDTYGQSCYTGARKNGASHLPVAAKDIKNVFDKKSKTFNSCRYLRPTLILLHLRRRYMAFCEFKRPKNQPMPNTFLEISHICSLYMYIGSLGT